MKRVLATLTVIAAALYLGNNSRFVEAPGERPYLIAHRGVHQQFDRTRLTGQTCTAARMVPSGHGYLENTLDSMRAAFSAGADAIEIDVHPTTDGHFAVFHDWRLDCRTEGSGVTREHTLAELQALDVGYGYTADGGTTFPFRGQGVGAMPSLGQVLAAFREGDFVIDIKGDDPAEGELLAARLAELTPARRAGIMVNGGPRPIAVLRDALPDLLTVTRPRLKRCLVRYLALGWSGHVPEACEKSLVLVPANAAPWLWGWPHRLQRRLQAAGSRLVLMGDYHGGGISTSFDDPERVRALPAGYAAGIWTGRIELTGPLLSNRRE